MKKWELERKKKQHQQLVKRAKPTIKTAKTTHIISSRSSSKLNSTGRLPGEEEDYEGFVRQFYDQDAHATPIFKLLKAFNLQQYSKKLSEMGYETEIYRLVLLSEKQKGELVEQLRVLPGHKAKLLSLIDMIKEIYPRESVLDMLASTSSTYNNHFHGPIKKKQRTPSLQSSSVKRSYNQIDASTRQFFKQEEDCKPSAHIVKEISLKTTQHARVSQPTKPGVLYNNRPQKRVQSSKKKQRVKQKDIMAMIYPSVSYEASVSKAVEDMEQTLRSGGGVAYKRKQEMKKAAQRIKEYQKSQQMKQGTAMTTALDLTAVQAKARRKNSKLLTIVNEKLEEEEEMELSKLQSPIERQPPVYAVINLSGEKEKVELREGSTHGTMDQSTEHSDRRSEEQHQKESSEIEATPSPDQNKEVVEERKELLSPEEKEREQKVKERIVANKFGASFGHEVRKAEDLVKGDEMCRAFAIALLRHIEFSQACFHMDDLNMVVDEPDALEFSYNLGNSLLKFKKKKNQNPQDAKRNNTKNFQELERKMISSDSLKIEDSHLGSSATHSPMEGEEEQEEEVQEEIAEFLSDKEEQKLREEHKKMKYQEIEGNEEEEEQELHKRPEYSSLPQQEIDFDYTETQLEQFLQSQNLQEGKMRTSSLISSFMKSLNRFSYNSQKNVNQSRRSVAQKDLDPIESNSENSPESPVKRKQSSRVSTRTIICRRTEISRNGREQEGEDDDDFQRAESELNADLRTHPRETPSFQLNPVTSLDDNELEQLETAAQVPERMECQESPDPVEEPVYDQEEELRQHYGINNNDATLLVLPENEIDNSPDEDVIDPQVSALLESQYEVPRETKEDIRRYLLETMKIFDENYCYEDQRVMGDYPPQFWGNPSQDELFDYCHYILVISKMETQIPIIALAYIERLLLKTGVLLNFSNWRKLVLATMILGSKIWDDDSFENHHFAQVFPQFSLKEINALERTLLELLDYNLMIKGSEYAKFFFLLRSLFDSKYKKKKAGANVVGMPSNQGELQQHSQAAGALFKEMHKKRELESTM